MIDLLNVCAGYGSHRVLQDVSASFEKGCLTSVIGINGCGKSTLLKAILNMVPLSSGEITIDGTALRQMTQKNIAQKVAYLPQEKNAPDMTVEQMVLHGRFPYLSYPRHYTQQDRQIVCAAMAQLGITAIAHKPLHTLSGGMRQNAYIAMALAQSTDYILLDEPTTFLDISHQLSLMKTLRSLADGGKGIVTVMHDLPMAFTFSDRILLLRNGKILRCDKPENLFHQAILEDTFGITLARSEDQQSYHYRYHK